MPPPKPTCAFLVRVRSSWSRPIEGSGITVSGAQQKRDAIAARDADAVEVKVSKRRPHEHRERGVVANELIHRGAELLGLRRQ